MQLHEGLYPVPKTSDADIFGEDAGCGLQMFWCETSIKSNKV
jgi:hypothetical protein